MIKKQPITYKVFPNVSFGSLILFFVWPFAFLVSQIRKIRNPDWIGYIMLFGVFFGFTFVYEDPLSGCLSSDSASYALQLMEMHENPFRLVDLVNSFYNPGSGLLDIYQPLVTWLFAIFTDNPKFLFAFFGGFFALFYGHNLWIVFTRISKRISYLIIILMVFYAIINPIWNINGVRMWTAAQVFVFGILNLFVLSNRKYWIWLILSVLIHFSFFIPAVVFFAFKYLPKKESFFVAFYLITLTINEIDLFQFRTSLSFLPEILQPKVQSYTNERYAEGLELAMARVNWYVRLQSTLSVVMINIWVVILYLKRNSWRHIFPNYYSLFLFLLLFGGIANILANVPSGARFLVVSDMLFIALVLLIYGNANLKIKLSPLLASFIIAASFFVIIFKVRVGMDYIGPLLFFGNPFIVLFIEDQTPLIQFIKGLL